MNGFKLGVITDEISQDIVTAAALAKKYGVLGLEIRTVFGKAPQDLNQTDIAAIKTCLSEYGLVCCGISSPFYKCDLNKPEEIKQQLEILKRCIFLANELGTTNIRGFAFWKNGDIRNHLDEIVNLFYEPITLLKEAGMTLLLENEPATFAGTAEEVGLLVERLNTPVIKALWDPGNDIYGTNEIPFPDGYQFIKQSIGHVHLKDAVLKNGVTIGTAFGNGEVDFKGQLKALSDDLYNGWCVLEPHYRPNTVLDEESLKKPGGIDFSKGGEAATEECLINLTNLLRELGLCIL